MDAVSSATTKGWKDAVQTAIKNALKGEKTSTGGDSGDDNTSDAGKTVYGSYSETDVTIYEGETVTLSYDSDGANDFYTYSWSTSDVSPSGCVSIQQK